MDFVKAILDQSSSNNYLYGVVRYEDDKFTIIIDSVKYNVVYNIAKFKVLYSLPSNTVHPAWTKRVVKSIPRPDLVAKVWSPIKPNQKVCGTISGTNFIVKYEKVINKKLKK